MAQTSASIHNVEDLMRVLTKLWMEGEIDMRTPVTVNGSDVHSIWWGISEVRLESY